MFEITAAVTAVWVRARVVIVVCGLSGSFSFSGNSTNVVVTLLLPLLGLR